MGVRNLTIDRAPIKPSDNAKDDFTINIIKNVTNDNIGIIELIWCLLDIETDLALKTFFNMKDDIKQHIKTNKNYHIIMFS